MKCDNCRYKKMCYRRINPMGDKYSNTDNCGDYETYEERPHGEWVLDKEFSFVFNIYECSKCRFNGSKRWHFCPNCGASMSANDRQVTGKLKQPCPCETCQTAIDRCGCQMHLCSDYQKWKEGDGE